MINEQEIIDFVNNKKIILVGNSDNIVKKNYGYLIDSFDLICRFNHSTNHPNLGNRTDIWVCAFNNIPMQEKRYNEFVQKPKYVLRLNDDGNINPFLHDKGLYVWHKSEKIKFDERLGCLPSSGLNCIEFLITKTNANVTLIGFDGFQTKTYYNSQKIAHKYHNVEKEKNYINTCVIQNKVSIIECN